ncbi:MAG: hypothetical protein ACOX4J_01485 [Anaerovoracaceae bacterium]|jgi:hypothetical protein
MKQIIVLVAMIALGVAVAGFVMGFGDSAESLANASIAEITYEKIVGE